GWKAKHFKGMSLEEIREKLIPVWKQIEDFVPMGSKEERERFKRKCIRLEKESAKKVKTLEEEIQTEGQRTYWKIIRLGGNTAVYQLFIDMLKHNDIEELVNVLTSLDAASILTSGVQMVSVLPAAEVSTVSVPTGSGLVPTASIIFTTASVVTPYSKRKAREMEKQIAREDQRMNEQIARDAEIARIHAEEEL
nr:hypothetical protein [Tanacetum cinerariifolium]